MKHMNKIYSSPIDCGEYDGRSISAKQEGGFLRIDIWMSNRKRSPRERNGFISSLSHECYHSMDYIIEHAGIEVEAYEPRAYSFDHLFENALDFYFPMPDHKPRKKKPKKKKKK